MLTNLVPLRSTAEWNFFETVEAIPQVYGRSAVIPLKYDKAGLSWVIAGHSIEGIDRVVVDDTDENEYQLINMADTTGGQVAMLSLRRAPADSVVVYCRGKTDPVVGGLLINPGRIMWDLIANVGGIEIDRTRLDAFSHAMSSVEFAGVVDDPTRTLRSYLDDLQRSAGAAASLGVANVAVLFPQLSMPDDAYVAGNFTPLYIDSYITDLSLRNRVSVMRVNFNYSSVTDSYGGSVQYRAVVDYGRVTREINAPWLVHARDAAALCDRLVKYYSRPLCTTKFNSGKHPLVEPGEWVNIGHPNIPLTGNIFVRDAAVDLLSEEAALVVEAAIGPVPTTVLEYSSTVFPTGSSQLFVSYSNGVATFTIRTDAGTPIPGATVSINGAPRSTNAQGEASFTLKPGTYLVTVQAEGYVTQTFSQVIA